MRSEILTICMLSAVIASTAAWAQPFQGFTEPSKTVQVAATDSGLLASVAVTQGQSVEPGDLLCSLDTEIHQATLAIAEAKSLATGPQQAAQATLALKQRRLEKLQDLHTKGHASAEEVDRAAADVTIAQADVVAATEHREQARLEVERIKAQIRRRHIRSPIQGVVIHLHREQGEFVSSAEPLLATIVQLDELTVRFHLPTDIATSLNEGDQLSLRVGPRQQPATGEVAFISPVTDANSGTVRVELRIDNREGDYRSGARCLLQLPAADGARATFNPLSTGG